MTFEKEPEHLTKLRECKFEIEGHEISAIDQEYFQVNMAKRNQLTDIEQCATFLQQFELLMHRTIKSEEKIYDIVNTLAMIQSSKSQNDEKVKRFEELRVSLRELDMYLTGTT